jgi:nucleotidyltransferase/DNA polymerase involved in DNA repair
MQHRHTYPHPPPREPLFLALAFEHFSAQVIAAYDPAYVGRPYIVVSQAAADSLAMVQAQSPWVTTSHPLVGMPLHVLRRRYPGVETVTQNPEFEKAARTELGRIYEHYTPVFTIDRNGASLLNMSGTPAQRSGIATAIKELKQEIRRTPGLSIIAAGTGATALMAKTMARSARPAGIMVCPAGGEEEMLAGIDVRLLPGLSPACRDRLAKYGLRHAGQVRRLGRAALVDRFGAEGELLYALTSGNDTRPAASPSPSIMVESVLERDTNDADMLLHTVRICADKLCHELKIRNLATDRLTVTLCYRDGKIVQKTASFGSFTDDFTGIAKAAATTFDALHTRRVGVRTIRLQVKKPEAQTGQLNLFESIRDMQQRRVSEQITDVRRRMSFGAVCCASDLRALREQGKKL